MPSHRRSLFSLALLASMAALGQEEPKPIVPVGEEDEPWFLEFVAACEAIGARLVGREGADRHFEVPRARMPEFMVLWEKYITDETREAYARQRGLS